MIHARTTSLPLALLAVAALAGCGGEGSARSVVAAPVPGARAAAPRVVAGARADDDAGAALLASHGLGHRLVREAEVTLPPANDAATYERWRGAGADLRAYAGERVTVRVYDTGKAWNVRVGGEDAEPTPVRAWVALRDGAVLGAYLFVDAGYPPMPTSIASAELYADR